MPSPAKATKVGSYSVLSPTKKSTPTPVETTHESFSVLQKWSDALVASEVDAVLGLYAESAVLWPTLSDEIRYSKELMRPYFEMFVQMVIGAVVWKGAVLQEISETSAVWSGLYGFPMADSKEVDARFTYVLVKEGESWKIATHHSSLPPASA